MHMCMLRCYCIGLREVLLFCSSANSLDSPRTHPHKAKTDKKNRVAIACFIPILRAVYLGLPTCMDRDLKGQNIQTWNI